jgi:peptidoglycan-associated lipoprotein
MSKGLKGLAVALGVMAMFAAGCAKDEVVKKDEPVVQQTVAPEPPKPAPAPAPKPEPKVEEATTAKAAEVISLETVYFDFDKSDLRQDTLDVLANNALLLLNKVADAKIRVEGHCDERGTDEYNLALGDRRAKSVANHLIKLGVAADRIATISFGEERPAVEGNDEAAWSKNRRAEFVIVQ